MTQSKWVRLGSVRRFDRVEPDKELALKPMEEGLDVIRVACVQPVGTSASERVKGAVSSAEYERAKMMVVMGAMQLWASGKLDLVEVDAE